jgi:Spy/CpxP family protein refolding chaperone
MIQIRSAARSSFFFTLLAAAAALPLVAQPDGGLGPPPDAMEQPSSSRGPSVDRELKQLTKQLTLTADQQTGVKTVLTERNQKIGELMRSMRSSGEASQPGPPSQEQFEQMRSQMKAIRDDANTKISALLTADQATKFAALLKERARHGDDGQMPPGPPPDGGMGGPPSDGGPGGGGPGGGGPPNL